jgi:CPA1 family monovalent cation:H+ antiporter
VISTFIIGFASYYLLNFMGIPVQLIHAMLLIPNLPTDPIAVLSILKVWVSKSLETKIAGEYLMMVLPL